MNDSEAGTSRSVTDTVDVFLNHRGPDVKATFVAHLEEALRCAGFRPFLDARSLRKGNPALKSIDQALDMAQVHIAVVSRGYAESKYSLDELVAMMRSGKHVIPVLYDVEPEDLQLVKNGRFAAAFEIHKSKERTAEKVPGWAGALGELAEIRPFRLADYKWDEAKLKREVVNEVARRIPSNRAAGVERYRVGLEGPTNSCVEMLEDMGGGTGILGLVGVPGIGKTTLAREIYNHYVDVKKFRHMSFLEVHRDSLSSSNVQVRPACSGELRKDLLWDLLSEEENTANYRSWFGKVSALGPVFIVIDDVDKLGQFEDLIRFTSLLHPGSRIVITCRDGSVISRGSGKAYDVSILGWDDSNMLFNLHAFDAKEAPEEYKDSAKDVVKACGGLPLTLKVIGSLLSPKRADEDLQSLWREAIDALRESRDVMGVLRWSYDTLPDLEKLMFLDITCVFFGRRADEALAFWTSCRDCTSCGGVKTPYTSLRNLMDKSIIKESYRGRLGVHDLLRDLGQEIGRKAGSHLVCGSVEDGRGSENQGTVKTRGLNLVASGKRMFDVENFEMMKHLHFLVLPDGGIVNGDFGRMSRELRWLRWRGMPYSHIPGGLNLPLVTSLDFSGSTKLASLWTESNVSLEACVNLFRLNLGRCTSITELPDSIGQSSRLQYLKLKGCSKLRKLPESIGQLKGLWYLKLGDCSSLKALPDTIGDLSNLRRLYAYNCTSLVKLPTSIGKLSQLRYLKLNGCRRLKRLPKSIGELTGLGHLDVGYCGRLKALPDSIGSLSYLGTLYAHDCTSLRKLPTSIGLLSSLQTLWIGASINCQTISGGTWEAWPWLRTLELHNCAGLGSVLDYGALRSLEELTLHDSTLTELPESIGLLVGLTRLKVSCERLQCLPKSIGALKMLQLLWLTFLKRLPKNLGDLASLKDLYFWDCPITELPRSIGLLSGLQSLGICRCKDLRKLPSSISQLKSLKRLELHDCSNIEAMGALRSLQGLPIWGNTSISKLPASVGIVSNLLVGNGSDKSYYRAYIFIEREVLEEDESGFLKVYHDVLNGLKGLLRLSHEKQE